MAAWLEGIGNVAAACTTLCWAPQAVKIVREKRTEGISLITQSVFTFGVALWLVSRRLAAQHSGHFSSQAGVTLLLSLTLLILKLRYP